MPDIKKKRLKPGWIMLIVILLLTEFALIIWGLLQDKNVALFNPKGLIAREQHSLIIFTVTVLFMIAIPALFLLYFVAWKYRESNTKARHSPEPRHSKFLVLSMWSVPTAIMLLLVSVMAPATHRLAPQRVIATDAKPITIQVISLRWKWLFIYPDQQVASLNFVQLPLNTPVTFEMTADETPMSSFWIPNLGGQLYTMTSHVNRLNLMADKTGDYTGSSAEINGAGFAGMKFTARVGSAGDFDSWVQSVKQTPDVLDTAKYQSLLSPSEYNPSVVYSSFDSSIYANVIRKYEEPGGHSHH